MRVTHLPRCGALLLVGVLLTGCGPERESDALPPPGSAPAGTSSAAASASPGTVADDEATGKYAEVPTDLQLSESEKAAAREALVMVDEYYAYYFDMMKSGGEDYDRMNEYSSDAALAEAEQTATDFRNAEQRVDGSYSSSDSVVTDLDLDVTDDTTIPFAKVSQCIDITDAGLIDKDGNSLVGQDRPNSSTHTFTVARYDNDWRVSRMEILGEEC